MQSLDPADLKVSIRTPSSIDNPAATTTTGVPLSDHYDTTLDTTPPLTFNLILSPTFANQGEPFLLEWAEKADFYMRRFDSYADMETALNPRNPESYGRDTAFHIHSNKFVDGYIAVESASTSGIFLRNQGCGKRLVMELNQSGDDEAFGRLASFRFIWGWYFLSFPALWCTLSLAL